MAEMIKLNGDKGEFQPNTTLKIAKRWRRRSLLERERLPFDVIDKDPGDLPSAL